MGKGPVKRISPYAKVARLKVTVQYMVLKYKPKCPFCKEVISLDDLMKGHRLDNLTVHHKDENRRHNEIENLILAHRGCHRRFHRVKELKEQKAAKRRKA
jgi:5-methylcytosine-specific restriction endonuclease McrA